MSASDPSESDLPYLATGRQRTGSAGGLSALGDYGAPLGLDDQNSDRALLTVPEPVVHEWKLARDVTHEVEDHATAGDAVSPGVDSWIAGGAPRYTVSNCSPTT